MNDKQLEQKKHELREEMRAQGFGWINCTYVKPPKKYRQMEKELSCIGMINSLLAYNCAHMRTAEEIMQYEENAYHNYLEDYVKELGRNKVLELIQGQLDSKQSVATNVYTDSEGLSYNSIIWKEV